MLYKANTEPHPAGPFLSFEAVASLYLAALAAQWQSEPSQALSAA